MGGMELSLVIIGVLVLALVALVVLQLANPRIQVAMEARAVAEGAALETRLYQALVNLRGVEVSAPARGSYRVHKQGTSVLVFAVVTVLTFPVGLLIWLFHRPDSELTVAMIEDERGTRVRFTGRVPKNTWRDVSEAVGPLTVMPQPVAS